VSARQTPIALSASLAQARRALADTFRQAGLETPDLDARHIVEHALGLGHAALAAQPERLLSDDEILRLNGLAARRLSGEPVARILGEWEFWGLTLTLNDAALVPRPETETIVETALSILDRAGPRDRALRITDLGTGSGAILLALLSELPSAFGVATDISVDALQIARTNAHRLGLANRCDFVACDFGAALGSGFDLVVSNPPYIASDELAGLPPEVRNDPARALDGGPEGLDAYRTIAAQAPRLMAPGGALVLELGLGQEPSVAQLLRASGLAPQAAQADLLGIPRALPATLPAWQGRGSVA